MADNSHHIDNDWVLRHDIATTILFIIIITFSLFKVKKALKIPQRNISSITRPCHSRFLKYLPTRSPQAADNSVVRDPRR